MHAVWTTLVLGLVWAISTPAAAQPAEPYDLVLTGGRVMDPESGLDARRNLGIRDGRVATISRQPLRGRETLDVAGLVVAPGFIDLHAHGQNPRSNDFQARDGVTTALDLEAGAYPVGDFLASREGRARLHFGVSAGHIPARVKLKHGIDVGHALTTSRLTTGLRGFLLRTVRRFWQPTGYAHEPADAAEIEDLLALLRGGLDQGGLGIGLGIDYTPGATPEEIRSVFALAAERGVPVFVHMRGARGPYDMSEIDALLEHVRATGVALHLLHVTSSGLQRTPVYLERLQVLRALGHDVSVEAYPYTAASTLIESAFFDEGWQERIGIDYADLQWSASGERLDRASFERYRRRGGPVIIHMMDEQIVDRTIAHPMVMIASDGIPFFDGGEHPRGAGTFARVLGHYVREKRLLTLMGALRKMTLMPAQRLEAFAPDMRRKGRLREGADADVTIFDADTVLDRASYDDSWQASDGIVHVLVEGTFVVRDAELVPDAFPGRAIRSGAAAASAASAASE